MVFLWKGPPVSDNSHPRTTAASPYCSICLKDSYIIGLLSYPALETVLLYKTTPIALKNRQNNFSVGKNYEYQHVISSRTATLHLPGVEFFQFSLQI